MSDIQKMDLNSKNITEAQIAKLKDVFPEIFTEGDKIDFEKFKLTLGASIDTNDERFGIHWSGKKECFSIIQEPSNGTLKPTKQESVDWENTQNLFIEGDNLEVLKLLQKSYYGKVKMIYIDPPYNTGGEFIYPDKYQENLDTYLAYSEQVDNEGYKFSTNTETEGRYHSNWLNMMYPRLFLARNLLKEDGVIFISINEVELHNLTGILDEIYGSENFRGLISRSTGTRMGSGNTKMSSELDYILVYSKSDSFQFQGLAMSEADLKIYDREDEKGKFLTRSLRRTGGENRREDRPSMFYPAIAPDGTEVFPLAPEGWESRWVCGYDTYKELEKNDGLEWKLVKKNDEVKWKVYQKHYLGDSTKYVSNKWDDIDGNKKATREVNALFGGIKLFEHPKPVDLLKRIILISSVEENDVILDFFSGSCTTSDAVIQLNKNSYSNAKFIMVQLPEPTQEKKEAYKQGYKNIADVGKERIRQVIKKIEREKQSLIKELREKETTLNELEAEKAKTPKLFENGKSKDLAKLENKITELKAEIAKIESTDLGFKVFKLDKSNFKIWDGSVENDVTKQIEMAINHIEPESNEFDILFEILLKAGFELTLPIEEITLADKKVYSVENDALLICLEDELNENVIRAIASKKPARVVCLDAGFKNNDQLKTNAVQIMKSHKVHDFKTV